MALPNFYIEGSTPLRGDSEHRLNQKILGMIRSQQGGSGVSDDDLISLAALGTTGLLTRVGAGDWRGRSLIKPQTGGFTINFNNGVLNNPLFALQGDMGRMEELSGTGLAVRTVADPEEWIERSITSGVGITVTNGSGVAGNPSVAININGLTEEATPDDQDYLAIYDISAAGHRKVRRSDFFAGLTASGATAKAARISASPSHTPSVTQNVHTAHTFDTEDFDTDTIGDLGTNNTRLTCKTAGRYVICGDVQFDSDNTGNRREIWVRKNGSIRIATQAIFAAQFLGPEMNIITVVELAVNDYVELMVFTSGTNGGLAAANHFEMMAYT